MDRKEIAIVLTSLAAVLGIGAKVVSGDVSLDGGTVAALWGAASPAIGLITAKIAVDRHVDDKHAPVGDAGKP